MTQVAVYAEHGERPPSRQALAYAHVARALRALVRHDLCEFAAGIEAEHCPVGLTRREPSKPAVALGMAAHLALADTHKRTVLAGPILDLGAEDFSGRDLERFIWSCSNTRKIVALGRSAWWDAQLLPIPDLSLQDMPPLELPCADRLGSILVIDHDQGTQAGRDLTALLQRRLPHVAYVGSTDASCWATKSETHVHVGRHAITDEALRLVDSWQSRRLVVHLLPGRSARLPSAEDITVADGVNGFSCLTAGAILGRLDELRSDRVLRQRFRDNGEQAVAPLVQGWSLVARELTS